MTNEQILAWNEESLLADVVGYETHEVALSAQGADVATYRGGSYLDFTSGIAVHACGHNHPDVVAAIREQAGRVIHTSDVMRHAPQLELAHRLRELLASRAPGPPWTFQFLNSGSESIDAAAKLALKATGRSKFVAMEGAFHGRTLFATALSNSNLVHRTAYEPLLSHLDGSILRAPAPRPAPRAGSPPPPDCVEGVRRLLEAHGSDVAALFIEPQQGEGGYHPMSPETAAAIREITAQHGVLLIADEIQSGFGRTGRWFAFEHLGIVPDILVFGKSVGGGLPLAGLAARQPLISKWSPGEHGTTFGGNPIACAAGLAALRVIEAEGLAERAWEVGLRAKARLCALLGKHGVCDVRGNGLMLGIELRDQHGAPDYSRVSRVKQEARNRGLLILGCGARIGKPNADNSTIRLLPPLNVTDEEMDRALTILTQALASVTN